MKYEDRYIAFLETVANIRPALHRFCSRMTGSVLDGEDVVQETLFHAYQKLETYDDTRPLKPWLFQIAHNRCIDFLRRRAVRQEAESVTEHVDSVEPSEPVGPVLDKAIEYMVLGLPPKERACVLLKDVFDYSLEEIAGLVDSTVGGVKAALNRGRTKLAALPKAWTQPRAPDPDLARLLQLYVERFNNQDWNGLRELISADATLTVADRFTGPMRDAPYLGIYQQWETPLRMAVGEVDGEPAVIIHSWDGSRWAPWSLLHFDVAHQQIRHIADYIHCPWILPDARTVNPGDVSSVAPEP